MFSIKKSALFHLFYPHQCAGCGSDMLSTEQFLCITCIQDLPHTHFAQYADNPVEKVFWGRLPVYSAMSAFYFSKSSIVQNLIHELKYKGNKSIGKYAGNLIGKSLEQSIRFKNVDAIIPLPLFEKKEKLRGYNQAQILCEGICEVLNTSIIENNVIRKIPTETQTRKGRTQRWENVADTFSILNPDEINGRHVLLVDDVITTGATLEACGAAILKTGSAKLSIATLAMATH